MAAWQKESVAPLVLRVFGVSFDLDRPAVEAGDQQSGGHARKIHRRGKALRHAGPLAVITGPDGRATINYLAARINWSPRR